MISPEPINDTTFEVTLPGGEVEIGDREAIDFKPHIKLNRWDGECFITVELPSSQKKDPVIDEDKIRWDEGSKRQISFYPTLSRLGGFEFDVTLKEKPTTNELVFIIKSQGLEFHYQPALTEEEIASGCSRPDNVVGSYAVYHATRTPFHSNEDDADKYKCGKAFHIYRPKVTDDQGNWVWGELSIDGNVLTVTIPQDFLDSAVYPVTIDPNFGYESVGGSAADIEDKIRGSAHACPGAGTANYIRIATTSWNSGEYIKCGLYLKSDASLKGTTAQRSTGGADGVFHTFTFGSPPAITATDYVLCAWGNVAVVNIKYDAISFYRYYKSTAYNGFPNPFDGSVGDAAYKFSIYCTYTAAVLEQAVGSGAITPAGALGLKTSISSGAGSITPSGVLTRLPKIQMGQGAVTPSGVLGFLTKITVGSGSITPTGALVKWFVKIVGQGAITPAGVLGRKIFKAVGSGSVTPSGILNRLTKITIGEGAITPSGVLSLLIKITVGDGSVTPAGGILSRTIKIVVGAGSVTPTGALSAAKKFIQWVGQGVITPTGSLSTFLRWAKSVGGGAITPVGTLGRKIAITIGGAITPTGTLGRKTAISVGSGAITPTGALTAFIKFFLAVGGGDITPVGILGRKIFIAIGGGAITPAGALNRKTAITVGGGAVTPTGTLARKFVLLVGQGAVAIVGTLNRFIKISVGGGYVEPAGSLIAFFARKLSMWLFHRPYRDVTIQARAYRDLTIEARTYRDLSLEVRG